MATRLIFVCAGATASSRIGAFAHPDEPLDKGGVHKAAAYRPRGPRPDLAVSSPGRAAIETAEALGLHAAIEPSMADIGYGDWAGRTLAEIEAGDPSALLAWLANPVEATPGGESMAALVDRVGAWIDRQAGADRTVLAVTHAAVLRAAISHAMVIPVASVMAFDIAPLGSLDLSFNGRWRFRELRRAAS